MVTYMLLLYVFVIVFKGLESQKLEIITPNGLESGIVGFGVHLKWNVDINIKEKDYSILKVENKLTKQLENTTKYTQRLDDTRIVLTINNVTLDDAGIYRCKLFATGEYKDIVLKVEDWKFQWIDTTNPTLSRLNKDVLLVWKYRSQQLINDITFHRYSNYTKEGHRIGVWTTKDGFKSVVSNAKLVMSKYKAVDELRLTLINATKDDFNLTYVCQVSHGANVNQKGIQLKIGKPKVYSDEPIITDYRIIFQWHYEYDYLARAIIFNRLLHEESLKVGFWMDGSFKPTLDGGQDRLKFEKKDLQGGAHITLKLLNPTEDDFRYTYTCKCVFIDRTTAVAASVAIKEPNGTNGYTSSLAGVDSMTIVAAVTTVVVSVIIVVVLVYKLRSKVKNTETEEQEEEPFEFQAISNEDVEDDISIGSTSTTSEQTLTRRRLRNE